MDLTSNPNFPNNPSSIEVLDKFDAPHNVDDNYGSRIRGFFKAPENGLYRWLTECKSIRSWRNSPLAKSPILKLFPSHLKIRLRVDKEKFSHINSFKKKWNATVSEFSCGQIDHVWANRPIKEVIPAITILQVTWVENRKFLSFLLPISRIPFKYLLKWRTSTKRSTFKLHFFKCVLLFYQLFTWVSCL